MDNNIFIKKLIQGTKDDLFEWKLAVSDKVHSAFKPYYVQKGDTKLLLEKYYTNEYDGYGNDITSVNCLISICDDNYEHLSEIQEDDLKAGGDLWRLYRLAERKVNNVDDIMKNFVEDINRIEF